MLLAFVLAFSLAAPTTAYADDGNSSGFDPLGAIASFFGVGDSAETYAVENADTVKVDPDTTNQWTNHTAPEGVTSTQNVGRIWTDKSVFSEDYSFSGQISGSVGKGSSDFLVSLSALSSTSNVRETVTTTEPLDIVLVLDDSGSMDEYMTMEGRYIEVPANEVVESTGHLESVIFGAQIAHQDTTGGTYYALVNGEYQQIEEITNRVAGNPDILGTNYYNEHVRWELNGQEVTPETTTFYRYEQGGTITRTEALQNAVNSFIDQTATLNGSIENQEDKIRISIVVFEDGATTENGLTVCEGNNVNTLKQTVNNLHGNGATNAGAGMRNANNVLNGSDRPNANQVVIFFTDGVPTTQSNFSESVANTAVDNAHAIKNRGGMVYSIGIFNGADPSQTEPGGNPSETRQANVFMNAVSSNYPNSSAWDNLGDRAQGDPDYYKATSDASELTTIFDEIFDETTSNIGSGSPIEEVTTGGANNTPGNLVFTDQLGSYMEVTGTGAGTDKMQLAYGDQLITSDSRGEARNAADNATVYTYHFSGTVEGNEVYHEANLADFFVVVTHYDDPAMGDQVTVTIPASLIPMRNYDVNTDNNIMTVSEAYPVRLFYGVSIKADVQAVLDDPMSDPELYSEVIKANASDDGQTLDFYSNAYNGGTDGATTSTFTPSDSNRFYYYTENEQLYLDEDCTEPANRYNIINNRGTLYYQDTYWQQGENGAASQETEHIGINVSGSDLTFVRYDASDNAYIPSGTQRLDRPNTLTSVKDSNNTETAKNVLHPEWSGNNVTQNLGNNGKMSFKLPGDLVITKNIDWGNASDQTKENQKNFTFQVNFNGDEPLDGNFAYEVYGSGVDPVSNGTIADNGTVTIEAGQRVVITGLPAGTTYTVTEQGANSNGFTTTDNSAGDGANTTDGVVEGMIVGGSQHNATFTNTYNASTPVNLSTSTTLSVQKVLDGRDWRDDDSFTFSLSSVQSAPASSKAEIVITDATGNNHTDSFGDITFTTIGEYRYTITEVNDDNPIVGIDYSAAVYLVTVNVVDGGNGNLAIGNVSIEQLQNDEGAESTDSTSGVQGSTVTFTNRYLSDQGSTTIDGTKVYDDTTGGNNIDANKFTFRLEALGGYDTGNKPGDGSYTYAAGETPMPAGAQDNAITTGNSGNEFHFPTIYFDGDDVGRTYEYKVTEVTGNEQGMKYDDTEYTLLITVTEEHDGQGGEAHAHIVATPSIKPTDLKFTNTYDPTDATLTGGDAIHGTKVLNGRSMNEGETFYFQLTQTDGTKVLDAPEIATVSAADGDMNFNFSDMTFSQTGDYTFTVNEVADANGAETTDGNGLVYSQNLCTVTVHVDDNEDGTLSATVEYNNSVGADNSQAVFTNTYTASMKYGEKGGIVVTKQLLDRNMAVGDFDFTITGEGDAADLIGSSDQSFENAQGALAGGTVSMSKLQGLTFDQDDAGKTYIFTVDEVDPAADDAIPGVVYDKSQYRVEIEVVDNGNGSMHTVTTVTRTMRATGDPDNTVVVDHANSDSGDYAVPTFGFVNDYNPNPAVIGGDADTALQVTKTVTGAPSPDGVGYNFTLTAQDTAEGPVANIGGLDGSNQLTVSTSGVINAGESQTVSFGQLTFSAPGMYTFTAQEDAPAEDAGWTYDTTPKTVCVVVTDRNSEGQYDGNLYIQNVTGSPVAVTNSYEPGSVTVGEGDVAPITVQKTVSGSDTQANFSFQLVAVDPANDKWDNVEVVDQGYDGSSSITEDFSDGDVKTATFGGIRFNAAGEYQFKIVENDTDKAPGGWTYDKHEATVTVTVTDQDFDGQLDATVTYDNTGATTDADKAVDNAAAFTNSYSTSSTDADTGSANVQLTKVLEGKAWDGDSFTFEIKPESNTAGIETADMPMPNDDADGDGSNNTVTVNAPTEEDGKTAIFSFGSITFDTPGTYVYKVTEVTGGNVGIDYSSNKATITIEVVDNHQGALVATVGIENNVFTNTYASELDYAAGGGLEIIKTFENADMREFNFTVTPKNEASADKLGIDMAGETFTTKSDATIGDDNASHAEIMVIDAGTEAKFTQDDADDTYTYTVQETKGDDASVTYDGTVYTVTITTVDDGLGGIKVTTTVTNGADYKQTYVYDNDAETENQTAVVPFTNTYKAEGQLGGNGAVSINATKTLTNRPMVDGEFTFNVTNTADDSNAMVTTGTNAADGTITFDAIDYSIDQMLKDVDNGLATPNVVEGKDTFTYTYKVTEDTDSLDDGVSAIDAAGFQITVTVTDNGDGTLGIVVAYPGGGDGLTFRNTYGESQTGQKTLNINGSKTLDVQSGNNAPDIEGKYTFTLTGSEGAPMPATTEAHNDAAGNVTFGDITFTMENVFGDTGVQEDATADETAADTGTDNAAVDSEASGESGAVSNAADVDTQFATRTKEFTYTVTESGNVPGVDNDAETSKTFTVTVTDNGDGSLSVESNPAQGALFSFTNTYNVDPEESSPTGEGGITITKNLDGRNLNDGEFAFELVDQNGTAVATGANDANGNVELGTVKFTEPGTFTYTIREAKGSLGGVTYDPATYKATATVTDNGDGTLKVEWSFTDAQGNPLGENASITFNNTYTAQPTSVSLGTGKLIEGRALAAGEFTFKLADADGNEISTATNEENGAVTFDTITYDTPGDYTYTITEVAPQDTDPFTDGIQNNGVTYDESVYNATVKVTDNGKGNLTAQISYSTEDGTAPLFVNTYTPPAEPEQGTDDGGLFGMAKTGDFMGGMMAVIAAVIAAAAGGAAYAVRKMRRPRGRHAR